MKNYKTKEKRSEWETGYIQRGEMLQDGISGNALLNAYEPLFFLTPSTTI